MDCRLCVLPPHSYGSGTGKERPNVLHAWRGGVCASPGSWWPKYKVAAYYQPTPTSILMYRYIGLVLAGFRRPRWRRKHLFPVCASPRLSSSCAAQRIRLLPVTRATLPWSTSSMRPSFGALPVEQEETSSQPWDSSCLWFLSACCSPSSISSSGGQITA